jgi:hypothetical protein
MVVGLPGASAPPLLSKQMFGLEGIMQYVERWVLRNSISF